MKIILIALGAIIGLFVLAVSGYIFMKLCFVVFEKIDDWFDNLGRTKEEQEICNFKKKLYTYSSYKKQSNDRHNKYCTGPKIGL